LIKCTLYQILLYICIVKAKATGAVLKKNRVKQIVRAKHILLRCKTVYIITSKPIQCTLEIYISYPSMIALYLYIVAIIIVNQIVKLRTFAESYQLQILVRSRQVIRGVILMNIECHHVCIVSYTMT